MILHCFPFKTHFASLLAAHLIVVAGTLANAAAQSRDHTGQGGEGRTGMVAGRDPNGKTSERLREGTRLIDVIGTLVSVGADSVTFSPEGGKDSYRVQENLTLQRVGQVLDENRGSRRWVVSGVITEYRGANYLLLTKAVMQLQEGDAAAGH